MSPVSHDSTSAGHKGVTNDPEHGTIKKKKPKASHGDIFEDKEKYNNLAESHDYIENITKTYNGTNNETEKHRINKTKTNLKDSYFNLVVSVLRARTRSFKNHDTDRTKCSNKEWIGRTSDNTTFKKISKDKYNHFAQHEYAFFKYDIQKDLSNFSKGTINTIQNKTWPAKNKYQFRNKNSASNTLKRSNGRFKSRILWRLNSGVLISLVMLNIARISSAVDTSTFSSGLTSRMIASFLGYPSTCNVGSEVRSCTLTLSCWLRGGTRLRGCGGWLFSCCGLPEPSRETFDNSISSSEWKYKPPTPLRKVPQRSALPNNVFRRRVDDEATQSECGLPSSRILQKRIIGGREARFAEFPWQAHVRISEFQCGGVLVSRRFVATAAHCVSRAHTRDIAVWLGAIDTSATHHPARKIGVIQKILHPLFQFRMTQPDRYDIALLKLSRPITYMSHILPICLPDQDMDLRGRSGVIAGWGKTDASNGHTGTNILRSANVPLLSKEQCINWHQSKQISVEIHSEMICAGHSDGHQDACLGDSGGPLIVFDNGRYYLVGITSAGFGCGVDHQPGIYHNVKLTANWIRSVISPSVKYNDNYIN